jgi:hypothetical protein
MSTVRDKLWLWGHEAGSHNGIYGLPGCSRMTPAEAAFYLGVPNLIMVRFHDRPAPPFDQYALPFRPLKRVVWSIVGAAGKTDAGERQHVIDLATRNPNITGVMMDDFFTTDPDKPTLSVQELQQVRQQLSSGGRALNLWVVLYDHQLGFPVRDHLALCDKVTFWTWKAHDLTDLERNFARAEQLAPRAGKFLGCYMWDYGQDKPLPLPVMQQQCEIGLRWLREGRIEGVVFLASCICDLGLETVEWTRQWIAEVGEQKL